jgi:hypothetical protein
LSADTNVAGTQARLFWPIATTIKIFHTYIRIDATPEKKVLLIFARKASFFILK